MSLVQRVADLATRIGVELKKKVNSTDARLSDAREWTATDVTQLEAETGAASTARKWSALRVRQAATAAAAAWWETLRSNLAAINSAAITEATVPVVVQTDIGTGDNQIPLNAHLGGIAYMSPDRLVIKPQASVTPASPGDMVFELTNNATLVVRVRGSDGTVRSTTLTLV